MDITRAHGRAELGTLHEGPWPARLTGSERRASSFRSELHTHNSSLVFSHPRNRLRGPRPSGPKRGPSGPTRRAWPLGPGQSHWAVTRDGGRRAVLPFLPDDTLSPITGGLPRWAPEHLPGSFICAAPTASVKGAEFIFHNSSARGRVISPPFSSVDAEAQRGASLAQRHTAANSKGGIWTPDCWRNTGPCSS